MISNLLGLVFTVVFARILGTVDYGSLAALVSAYLIVSIAGSALQITVAREVSVELRKHDQHLRAHVRAWIGLVVAAMLLASLIGILARDPIASMIGVDELSWAAAAVLPSGIAWLLLSIQRGVMQGLMRYQSVGVSIIGESVNRLLCGFVLVGAGLGATGAFLASGVSVALTSIGLGFAIHRVLDRGPAIGDDRAIGIEKAELQVAGDATLGTGEPVAGTIATTADGTTATDWRLLSLITRTGPALVALSLIAFLQNTDVIMVKRLATEHAAGAYAADSVAAKVIIWVAVGLGFYVVPEAARRGRSAEGRMMLLRTIALVAISGVAMVLAYTIVGRTLLEIGFGVEFTGEAGSLPVLAAAMSLLAVTYLSCQFLLAIGHKLFLAILAAGTTIQLVVLAQVAATPADAALAMLAVQGGIAVALAGIYIRQRS